MAKNKHELTEEQFNHLSVKMFTDALNYLAERHRISLKQKNVMYTL